MRVKPSVSCYCIALDPGGTTGVAMVENEEQPWEITALHLGGSHHQALFRLLVDRRPSVVVCETFENRGQSSSTQARAASLVSREYIGIVKLYLQATGATGEWQSSSTGKQFWDDEKLKEYGLYCPGLKHARDAIRHYAYWRVFTFGDKSILRGTTGHIKTSPSRSQDSFTAT